jgi:hypothetical protein
MLCSAAGPGSKEQAADEDEDEDEEMGEAGSSDGEEEEEEEDAHAGVGVLAPGSKKGRTALAAQQHIAGKAGKTAERGGKGGNASGGKAAASHAQQPQAEAAGFEVVPLANGHGAGEGADDDLSDSGDSDAGLASMDPHSRAEVRDGPSCKPPAAT